MSLKCIHFTENIKRIQKLKRNQRLALKFRKRDRKEFMIQFENEDYLMDLMEVESEIDEFLKKEKFDVPPTRRMISCAKHSWPYNEMRGRTSLSALTH